MAEQPRSSNMENTDVRMGLTDQQVFDLREQYGLNEVPIPQTPTYMIFLRQFVGFLPLLIELAALVSLLVEEFVDFGIIVSILFINGVLGFREEYHAKKSLDELSDTLDSTIAVRRNDTLVNISTIELVPGDILLLVGGTVVPADCQWREGDKVQLDTAPLTGEPLPRKVPSDNYGDMLLSGTTVLAGECYAQVVMIGTATEIGRAQQQVLRGKAVRVVSVFQQKIMNVVQMLVTASLLLVIAVLFVEGFGYGEFDVNVKETVLDALSIMIASLPVALPLVIQVNLALGAAYLAKAHHAIVTSIPALQDIASMSILCSDKTGTLTTADMTVATNQIHAEEGFSDADVILYAYLCSNLDKHEDPIDRAIVKAFNDSEHRSKASDYRQTGMIGFNSSVKRVVAFVEHRGRTMTIAKGLPAKILDTKAGYEDDHDLQWQVDQFDDPDFVQRMADADATLSAAGYKTLGVAICEGDARTMKRSWTYAGTIPLSDPPRDDSARTIESLHHANISVKMITGDHVNVGKETARLIGMGPDIQSGSEVRTRSGIDRNTMILQADGFAAVLPTDKREIVVALRDVYGLVTGMTGDGVNDAPALAAAQVGIAVEGATDAAKNAADLILTQPGLHPIYGAVLESRRIFARIKAYVVYRVAASIILVLTLSIIIFFSGCAVDPLLMIVLALLNDLSMIPVAYDRASATTKPQIPNAKKLLQMSLYYGVVHSILSLIFIGLMQYYDEVEAIVLENRCSEATQGFIWFHLVLVTELMILSVRAPSYMIFSRPSCGLLASVLLTCFVAPFIAAYARDLDGPNIIWVVVFNIVSLFVIDIGKVHVRRCIGDDPGDVIESNELLVAHPRSLDELAAEKQRRMAVHHEAMIPPEERQHIVEVRDERPSFFTELRLNNIGGGFIDAAHQRRTLFATRPVVQTAGAATVTDIEGSNRDGHIV